MKRTTAFVGIGDDFPVEVRNAHARVVAAVLFVKDLHGVVAQRCTLRGEFCGFGEAFREVAQEREFRAALDEILNNAGVLAARHVAARSRFLIGEHRVVDDVRKFGVLLRAKFLQFGNDIIGQVLGHVRREVRHDAGEAVAKSLIRHGWVLLKGVGI